VTRRRGLPPGAALERLDPPDWPVAPESAHTAPNAVAPAPAWWHAPDSDSTEHEVSVLLYALARAIQPDLVVETGAAFGYSSYALGLALALNGHGQLCTLETDPGRAEQARERVGGLPVEVIERSSLDWTPPGYVQLAFFDSAYEAREQEFRRYLEEGCLRAGSIACFHDWTSGLRGHHYDVAAAVRRLDDAGLLRPVYLPTPRGLVIAECLG
jgi:predicted O-methyltransferase YrrM